MGVSLVGTCVTSRGSSLSRASSSERRAWCWPSRPVGPCTGRIPARSSRNEQVPRSRRATTGPPTGPTPSRLTPSAAQRGAGPVHQLRPGVGPSGAAHGLPAGPCGPRPERRRDAALRRRRLASRTRDPRGPQAQPEVTSSRRARSRARRGPPRETGAGSSPATPRRRSRGASPHAPGRAGRPSRCSPARRRRTRATPAP